MHMWHDIYTEPFDSSYFIDKSYLNDDISQNYLTSQPAFKYFQIFSGTVDKRLG